MWIQKPNPPTPFPAREGGDFLLVGEGLGERSSLVDRSNIHNFSLDTSIVGRKFIDVSQKLIADC